MVTVQPRVLLCLSVRAVAQKRASTWDDVAAFLTPERKFPLIVKVSLAQFLLACVVPQGNAAS
jgi:hypothetical protein